MNRIRHFENLHIALWLLKDMCWIMHFRVAGTIMVIPTVLVAIHLAWKTYGNRDLFLPNVAVCFWIGANGTWMLGEFFLFSFRIPALLLFSGGLCVAGWHYLPILKSRFPARK